MRIEDTNLAGTRASTGRTQPSSAPAWAEISPTGGTGRSDSGDRVELSSLTGALARTLTADAQQRADRVASLAGQFQSERYTADAKAASRGLVNETLSASAEPKAARP